MLVVVVALLVLPTMAQSLPAGCIDHPNIQYKLKERIQYYVNPARPKAPGTLNHILIQWPTAIENLTTMDAVQAEILQTIFGQNAGAIDDEINKFVEQVHGRDTKPFQGKVENGMSYNYLREKHLKITDYKEGVYITFTYDNFYGYAQGSYQNSYDYFIYDLATGKRVKLEDMIKPAALKRFKAKLVRDAGRPLNEIGSFDLTLVGMSFYVKNKGEVSYMAFEIDDYLSEYGKKLFKAAGSL